MRATANRTWRRHARLGTVLLSAAAAVTASSLVIPAQASGGAATVQPHQVSVADLPAPGLVDLGGSNPLMPAPMGLGDGGTPLPGTAQGVELPAPSDPSTSGGGGSNGGTGGPLGATSNVERLQSFEGIDYTGHTPPDTQLAVGPTAMIEMVNNSARISDRAGNAQSTFGLDSFYGSSSVGTDPRVVYDPVSGRYFASYELRTAGGDTVAVAASSDSTPWSWCYVYINTNSSGHTFDQPKLGISDDKVVVSWNEYNPNWVGSVIEVAQKSDLMTCAVVHVWTSAPDSSRFGLQPSAELSSTTTEWLTWHNPATNVIGAASVTGTPSAGTTAVSYTSFTFSAGTLNEPPAAHQPAGGDSTIATGDSRMLSSVFRSGIVWTSFTGGCTPPGSGLRDCAFFFRLDTSNLSSANVYWNWINNNFDIYYPSVTVIPNGDLVFGGTTSSTTTNTGGAVYVIAGAVFNGSFTGVRLATAALPYACACNRWGDYSATVLDPVDANDAWSAQEYGGISGCAACWGTIVGKVTRYTPAITGASLSTYTANSTCSPTVTLDGSEFARGDSVVHVAGFGVTPSWTSTDRISFNLPSASPQSTGITVTDSIGGSNAIAFTYVADTVAPASSSSVSPVPNGAGWNNTAPTVTLTSSDNSCGSGMSQLQWSATGAQPSGTTTVSGGPGAISTTIAITSTGVTTISYRGVDRAGVAEAWNTLTVRYDNLRPTAIIDGLPTQSITSGTPITGNAGDDISGIATVTLTFTAATGSVTRTAGCVSGCGTTFEQWSVSTAGLTGNYTVTATATDYAGNASLPSQPVEFFIS